MVHQDPNCHVTFDLVDFRSEYERADIRKADGRDTEIQENMRWHPEFIRRMMQAVETKEDNPSITTVPFACSYGKHRSMAFAELFKREYYPRSNLRHASLLEQDRIDNGRGRRNAKRANARK